MVNGSLVCICCTSVWVWRGLEETAAIVPLGGTGISGAAGVTVADAVTEPLTKGDVLLHLLQEQKRTGLTSRGEARSTAQA